MDSGECGHVSLNDSKECWLDILAFHQGPRETDCFSPCGGGGEAGSVRSGTWEMVISNLTRGQGGIQYTKVPDWVKSIGYGTLKCLCVSACLGCHNKVPKTEGRKQQASFRTTWKLKFENKVSAGLVF